MTRAPTILHSPDLESDVADSIIIGCPETLNDVAEVFHCERHTVTTTVEEALATARLFAAAEAMQGALTAAETHFGPFADITINGEHDPDDVRVVALIRAALAKSRGETA